MVRRNIKEGEGVKARRKCGADMIAWQTNANAKLTRCGFPASARRNARVSAGLWRRSSSLATGRARGAAAGWKPRSRPVSLISGDCG